jgi:hypothetical protein
MATLSPSACTRAIPPAMGAPLVACGESENEREASVLVLRSILLKTGGVVPL